MKTDHEHGKLTIRNGWVICPTCGKGKLLKILPSTTAHDLPRPCKLCGKETLVNIDAPEPASNETSA